MRKGLKRKTYQNLPSLICVEFCPYLGSNHRHHDLEESALRPRPNSLLQQQYWFALSLASRKSQEKFGKNETVQKTFTSIFP
jgi:hypothetical protein